MGMLVNIDNGGTLTDVCVIEGANVWRTKTLTTPFDLSRCLMDGLKKASEAIFGEEDVERLLLGTDHIRYSTTQGTNALVERKGPRLGLIVGGGLSAEQVRACNPELFDVILGTRSAELAVTGDDARLDAVRVVSHLAASGANRIVIAFGSQDIASRKASLKRALLKAFPAHLLGAVPILYSHEIAEDDDDVRRTWTAIFNAFLHPAMERFLYSAEQKLREARAQSPLLIFRNDGQSARVAKTVAVKTYSSGPRGGAEGALKLSHHYKMSRLVSVDIGGTTTDISIVENGEPRAHSRGNIAGVETSFPLTDVTSIGVGGSSIFRVENGVVKVGPDSVGSTPGPACFGFGGTHATMTDAFFASGLLQPASYFGGAMKIDIARAKTAIASAVSGPMNVEEKSAILLMEQAWVDAVATGLKAYAHIDAATSLAAFGGAGPFVICKIAEKIGVTRILIPKLASVFSAYGIGFSDIGHSYQCPIQSGRISDAITQLRAQAARGMAAEGIDPKNCTEKLALVVNKNGEEFLLPADSTDVDAPSALRLNISHALPVPQLTGTFGGTLVAATQAGSRDVLGQRLPLYNVASLTPGCGAAGPAVLEEDFFTCRIDAGWSFEVNNAGDILISRSQP